MSSQPVLVEGRSLLGTRSRNRRVYSEQVMQEAGAIFQPYVAGIFVDQLLTPEEIAQKWKEVLDQRLTPEEKAQKWKEEHINSIREAGEDYDC